MFSSEPRPCGSHFVQSIECPDADTWARALARSNIPPRLPLDESRATARNSRPERIEPTNPVNTPPGPTSTNVLTPSAYICSTSRTKLTGRANCAASKSRAACGSSGYCAAVVLA